MKLQVNYFYTFIYVICHCAPEGSVDDELGHVDDEPGEVAEEEHDDDADEDRGQVHLVVRGAVPVGPHVGVPAPRWGYHEIILHPPTIYPLT